MSEQKTQKRIIPLIFGAIVQLCLGTVYIWGVFQPYVSRLYGWDTLTTSLTFSIVIGAFTVGSIVGGKIQDKFNPQIVIFFGGIILGIGVFLAAFTKADNPFTLYGSYGIIGGFGMGTTYTTIIACCQKWFLDKKGLATGVIVASLGFGGVLCAPLAEYLLSNHGVPNTFIFFAIIFTLICIIGSLFIKNPPEGYTVKNAAVSNQNYTAKQMLSTSSFYILTISLLLAVPAYFLISPMIKIIGLERGLTAPLTVFGVMLASLLNSMGRLLAPWISDKIGRKKAIYALMVGTIVSILTFIFAQSYLVLVLIGLLAFCYGGFLGIYPTITSEFFGMKNAGVNYGIVLIGFTISVIFTPFISRALNSASLSFIFAAACALLGIVFVFFIKPPKTNEVVLNNVEIKNVELNTN